MRLFTGCLVFSKPQLDLPTLMQDFAAVVTLPLRFPLALPTSYFKVFWETREYVRLWGKKQQQNKNIFQLYHYLKQNQTSEMDSSPDDL